MRVGPASRVARASIVAVFTAAVVGVTAGPAIAATILVARGTAAPEQAVPVALSFSGAADPGANSNLDVIVRAAGGLPCQATYESDQSAAGTVNTTILAPTDQSVAPGAYQLSATYKPPQPGSYQVCAWLEQPAAQNASADVAGPATSTFVARGPVVSQLAVTIPSAPEPSLAFTLDYATQTDQQLNLYSVVLRAGEVPCASSYELQQQQGQITTTIFGLGARQVFGGPTSTTATERLETGSYEICAWVEGPNGGEVDLAASKTLTVGTPVAPRPPKPQLRLGRVTASTRHGVSVTGTSAPGFDNRVLVAASCGASRATRTTRPIKRRFATHMALPRGCAHDPRVKVTASWGGSRAFARQSTTKTVPIRR